MANIQSHADDTGVLHIHVDGVIDTSSVQEFDAFISEKIEEADSIVLDMKDVTYISSAGLRVILKADLAMKEKEGFFIENINEEVYEVFKLVNFHRFLNIYGKEDDRAEKVDEESVNEEDYSINECELTDEVKNLLPPNLTVYLNVKTISCLGIYDHSGNALVRIIEEIKDEAARLGVVFDSSKNVNVDFEKVLSMIDEYYNNKDINTVSVSVFGIKEKDYDRVLKANGYEDYKQYFQIPTKREEMLSSPFYKKAEKLAAELTKVKTYNELSDAQKMVLSFNFGIENGDSIDPVFAKFFTTEDDVKGILLAREIADNILVIYNINAMADKEARLAVPLMLASFLKICENFLDEGALLYFVCHTENQCKSLLKALEIKNDYDVIGEYSKDYNSYWE